MPHISNKRLREIRKNLDTLLWNGFENNSSGRAFLRSIIDRLPEPEEPTNA